MPKDANILAVLFLIVPIAVIGSTVQLRLKEKISGETTFKLIALAFIIGAAVFLISVGINEGSGFTAVIGLLGTGLGYVFGKSAGPPGDGKS